MKSVRPFDQVSSGSSTLDSMSTAQTMAFEHELGHSDGVRMP